MFDGMELNKLEEIDPVIFGSISTKTNICVFLIKVAIIII